MTKKDSGPAFPFVYKRPGLDTPWVEPGMTRRQWLAGKSITYCGSLFLETYAKNGESYTDKDVAQACYEIADAIIEFEKREKEE